MTTTPFTLLKETIEKIESDSVLLDATKIAGLEIVLALKKGNKILIAGNGGSAAEAQHFSAELIGRYKTERHPLPSVALTTDTSILTAIGNDYGYEKVFERQVLGLGNDGDILVLLSTSGNSTNLILAADAAKRKNIKIISLLGKTGGELKNISDVAIVIPSQDTATIQELHLNIIHTWCELVDSVYTTK